MTQDEARREEIRIMSLPGMQELFRDRMGEKRNSDLVHIPSKNKTLLYEKYYQTQIYFGACIVIPLPIDRDNPERGLWGMLDWNQWIGGSSIDGSGFYIMHQRSSIEFKSETPTLALLRALARQEGAE